MKNYYKQSLLEVQTEIIKINKDALTEKKQM